MAANPGKPPIFPPEKEEAIRVYVDKDNMTTTAIAKKLIKDKWIDRELPPSTIRTIANRARARLAKDQTAA